MPEMVKVLSALQGWARSPIAAPASALFRPTQQLGTGDPKLSAALGGREECRSTARPVIELLPAGSRLKGWTKPMKTCVERSPLWEKNGGSPAFTMVPSWVPPASVVVCAHTWPAGGAATTP